MAEKLSPSEGSTQTNNQPTVSETIYTPYLPLVREIRYDNDEKFKYNCMGNENFQEIKFTFPTSNVTIQGLLELYITDSFLKETADNSNGYGKLKGRSFEPITESDLCIFLAFFLHGSSENAGEE